MVEVVHRTARETIAARTPHLRDAIAPYRAGYTAEQRRELERRLAAGELRAVVATNALELGIDIGLLDCAISIGFPGTVASLRQQWGRAGRSGEGLAMLVASADALDQYFIRHPAMLIGRPVEAAILDHASAEIRDLHLACAAYEAPITEADDAILGAGAYAAAVRLTEFGDLRVTPAGVVWARGEFPAGHVALRSSSSDVVAIVDTDTGQILGTVEGARACRTVHEGAVYLHLGESWHVSDLDLEERVARVQPFAEQWYTQAQTATMTEIDEPLEAREELGVDLAFGGVTVTEQVLAYQRRALPRHEVIDTHELDLPPGTFATQALWFCVPDAMLDDLDDPLGSLHAAEHALISVLPLHRDVRPLGHRRAVDEPAPGHRPADDLHLRRPPGRDRHHPARLRRLRRPRARRARRDPRLPVQRRLPELRPVAEVRQPQRAPLEARRAGGDGADARRLLASRSEVAMREQGKSGAMPARSRRCMGHRHTVG